MDEPRLIKVIPLPGYILELHYETMEVKRFDVSPYIRGEWYSELRDESYFKSVRISSDRKHLEWRNGQDLAPHNVYENSFFV
jgi:hypothetical protein